MAISPFISGLVATSAGISSFPGFFHGLTDIIGLYVAFVLRVALLNVFCLHRAIVGLVNCEAPVAPKKAAKTLFQVNIPTIFLKRRRPWLFSCTRIGASPQGNSQSRQLFLDVKLRV